MVDLIFGLFVVASSEYQENNGGNLPLRYGNLGVCSQMEVMQRSLKLGKLKLSTRPSVMIGSYGHSCTKS